MFDWINKLSKDELKGMVILLVLFLVGFYFHIQDQKNNSEYEDGTPTVYGGIIER